jgi:RecB family endonuclease NucS
MKTISLLAVCALSLTGPLISISPALAKNDAGNNIHIDQSRQFPETRWANADHYIRIHVSHNSESLAELQLQVTDNLRFDINQVEVFDLQGHKIPVITTEVASNQNIPTARIINLIFTAPIAGSTQFDIRIKDTRRTLISRPSTYSISTKSVNSNQKQLIGEAYFRSY